MSFVTGLSNAISGIPIPKKVQRLFLETSKEGPAALVLPETSVIVGRSAAEAKRSGFLGLQERAIEETVVAALWFWGVGWMRQVFDKFFLPHLNTGLKHLSPKTAWNPLGKKATVDLTSQELFTRNATEVSKLMRIKGLRWLFSVGTMIVTMAYIIPKLNQKKTEWIIRHEEAKAAKEGHAASAPKASAPGAPRNTLPVQSSQQAGGVSPSGNRPIQLPQSVLSTGTPSPFYPAQPQSPLWLPGQPLAQPQYAFPMPQGPWFNGAAQNRPARNPGFDGEGSLIQPASSFQNAFSGNLVQPASVFEMPGQPGAPKFGGLGSVMQALGHAVEQTPYGSILVVDAGITGGRGYVAGQRSVFESVEVVFRDALSLYFYIMFAPHMMKVLGAAINPLLGTSLRIEPKVVETLHDELWKRASRMAEGNPALKAALAKGELPMETLRHILEGSPHNALDKADGLLKNQLRTAAMTGPKGQGFLPLLKKEAAAYLGNVEHGAQWSDAVEKYLQSHLADKGRLVTDDLLHLLKAIEEGSGDFAKLTSQERSNLSTAAKQAFRHSVGLPVELSDKAIRRMEIFQAIFKSDLPEAEKKALVERVQQMATRDGLDQVNSMYRRSLNISRSGLGGGTEALIQRMEIQADWIDQAVNRGIGLDELFRRELSDLKELLEKQKDLPDAIRNRLASLDDATPAQLKELEAELGKLSGRKIKKASEKLASLNGLFADTATNRKAVRAVQDDILVSIRELTEKAAGSASDDVKGVLQHYGQRMSELLHGRSGHLFTMYIDPHDKGLVNKILELTRGGLKHDSRFMREAQDIVGHLTTDSRNYADPKKGLEMRHMVSEYVEKLLAKAEKAAVAAETGGMKLPGARKVLTDFFKLNRFTHYFARAIALGGTMYALGILVPKLQYALTKRLTGKDEHPGIAKAAGHGKQAATAQPGAVSASSLSRNNFQAFKHQA